jgi:hypothetical protein
MSVPEHWYQVLTSYHKKSGLGSGVHDATILMAEHITEVSRDRISWLHQTTRDTSLNWQGRLYKRHERINDELEQEHGEGKTILPRGGT